MQDDPFRVVGDRINDSINRLVADSIKRTMNKIENAMKKLQLNMMTYLATQSGAINSASAPVFSEITFNQPSYEPLTEAYLDRKIREGRGTNFYKYKGNLQRDLKRPSNNGLNIFGKPVVTFTRKGQRGARQVYTKDSMTRDLNVEFIPGTNKSKTFIPLKKDIGTVSVDLYPELRGPLSLASGKFGGGTRASKFFTQDKIGYKLDNYHGRQNRQFLPQYMQWWLNVKGKQALRGAVA